ncbi:hypothetical protein ROZALSC1DRAFT_29201 [Rozella allomycis CSF55]|uniref:Uncharacterized protein n=1 Tax=Rozella allomycis (strain CSF55) TaxID=988480 RepID=A0A075B189_ROZAC|nr:hypothetical protein O9G_004671 [Rozella allomycis CSF55]RKP19168.1 hypothetical protein ROZALSC1DRAFT_29201 [Rozella allomycis CSF55]|eukprot:EPZ36301.1 hypothetical protein O9G_004671 [Rozella allomycis CSF55]
MIYQLVKLIRFDQIINMTVTKPGFHDHKHLIDHTARVRERLELIRKEMRAKGEELKHHLDESLRQAVIKAQEAIEQHRLAAIQLDHSEEAHQRKKELDDALTRALADERAHVEEQLKLAEKRREEYLKKHHFVHKFQNESKDHVQVQ